jgi:hypothetical protein
MISALLYALLLVFSLVLAAIAFLAFQQSSSPKILLVGVAFCLFAIKGAILSLEIFASAFADDDLWTLSAVLDVAIVGTILLATMKS